MKNLTAAQLRYLRLLAEIGDDACGVPIGPERRTVNTLIHAGLVKNTTIPGFNGVRLTDEGRSELASRGFHLSETK